VITCDGFPGDDNAFRQPDRNGDGVVSRADRAGKRATNLRKR